jgi:hypothetical protein
MLLHSEIPRLAMTPQSGGHHLRLAHVLLSARPPPPPPNGIIKAMRLASSPTITQLELVQHGRVQSVGQSTEQPAETRRAPHSETADVRLPKHKQATAQLGEREGDFET